MKAPNPTILPSDDPIEYLKMLIIWFSDLQMALSAITFLGEIDENETYSTLQLRRYKCFETTFIVAYCRPFTRAHGTRFSSLKLTDIGVDLDEDDRLVHARILNLRHQVYAHSDVAQAHVRMDSLDFDHDAFSLALPRIQFDEGMKFAALGKRQEAMVLCQRIRHALFSKIIDLNDARSDKSAIYIKPVQINRT